MTYFQKKLLINSNYLQRADIVEKSSSILVAHKMSCCQKGLYSTITVHKDVILSLYLTLTARKDDILSNSIIIQLQLSTKTTYCLIMLVFLEKAL